MTETRKQKMESDFNPGYLPESMPGFDTRLINAVEYSAYQLGQINRTLTRLAEILERTNGGGVAIGSNVVEGLQKQ